MCAEELFYPVKGSRISLTYFSNCSLSYAEKDIFSDFSFAMSDEFLSKDLSLESTISSALSMFSDFCISLSAEASDLDATLKARNSVMQPETISFRE